MTIASQVEMLETGLEFGMLSTLYKGEKAIHQAMGTGEGWRHLL